MSIYDPPTPTRGWETETGESPEAHGPASLAHSASSLKVEGKYQYLKLSPDLHKHIMTCSHLHSHTNSLTHMLYMHKYHVYTHVYHTLIYTSMLKVLYKIPYVYNVANETYLQGTWVSSPKYLMSMQILQILGEIFWNLKNYLSAQWYSEACILRIQQGVCWDIRLWRP